MEEYLEQLKSDETFYARIASDLTALESFPISRGEKKKIWFEIYLTAQNYELQKKTNSKDISERRDKAYDYFGKGIGEFVKEGIKATENNSAMNITKVNAQIGAAKQKPVLETIERDTQWSKGIGKNLGRVDSVMTAEIIVKEMTKGN